MCIVLLAITPTGRPSMRASAVTISGAKRSRRNVDRALVGERLDDRRDVVGAPLALGHQRRAARLVGRRRRARPRPGSSRAAACVTATASASSATTTSTTPLGACIVDRADVVGVDVAQPAARDHRRAAHADRGVLGRDDQVRAAGDHRVAGEAAALDDRDPRHEARQPRPQRERAHVRAPRRPGSRCRPGRPPPPSAKKTVGSRMRSISSNSRSFLRWPSAPCVPASTV